MQPKNIKQKINLDVQVEDVDSRVIKQKKRKPIYLFYKYLLNIRYEPGTLLSDGNKIVGGKHTEIPIPLNFTFKKKDNKNIYINKQLMHTFINM